MASILSISPFWEIPASKMPKLCFSCIAQRERGTPIWELKLLGLLTTVNALLQSVASHSLQMVLPFEPVMPMTGY